MRLKPLIGLLAGLLFAFTASATPQYFVTHRNAAMADIVTQIGSTGFLMIVTGSQPASASSADGGTLLVAMPMSSTAGSVSGGVLTFGAITSTNASATGTAGHFLICTSSNTASCLSGSTRVMQGSVGSSGADLNFSAGVSWTSGQLIQITSFTLTANGA